LPITIGGKKHKIQKSGKPERKITTMCERSERGPNRNEKQETRGRGVWYRVDDTPTGNNRKREKRGENNIQTA